MNHLMSLFSYYFTVFFFFQLFGFYIFWNNVRFRDTFCLYFHLQFHFKVCVLEVLMGVVYIVFNLRIIIFCFWNNLKLYPNTRNYGFTELLIIIRVYFLYITVSAIIIYRIGKNTSICNIKILLWLWMQYLSIKTLSLTILRGHTKIANLNFKSFWNFPFEIYMFKLNKIC